MLERSARVVDTRHRRCHHHFLCVRTVHPSLSLIVKVTDKKNNLSSVACTKHNTEGVLALQLVAQLGYSTRAQGGIQGVRELCNFSDVVRQRPLEWAAPSTLPDVHRSRDPTVACDSAWVTAVLPKRPHMSPNDPTNGTAAESTCKGVELSENLRFVSRVQRETSSLARSLFLLGHTMLADTLLLTCTSYCRSTMNEDVQDTSV